MHEIILQILICAVFSFSAYVFFVAWSNRNWLENISLTSDLDPDFKISVLIPARNEERNIARILQSLVLQTYSNLEIIVLDDQSDDLTNKIATEYAEKFDQVKVINGNPLSSGWMGKNWACHQLAQNASGDYLLFLDADVEIEKELVKALAQRVNHKKLDFLTVWPNQKFFGWVDRMAIQQVYFAVFSLLPQKWFVNTFNFYPDWMWNQINPQLAAACGQCLMFSASFYHQIGGHAKVKSEIVEDVELAKLAKSHRGKIDITLGGNMISSHMYANNNEVYQGFRKNFFAGFKFRIVPFLLMGSLQFLTVFLPPLIVVVDFLIPTSIPFDTFIIANVSIAMFWISRLLIHSMLHWPIKDILLQIPSIFWFWNLALRTILDRYTQNDAKWKSRSIRATEIQH